MHLESRFLTGFRQGFEEILAIHIIAEDVLPATAVLLTISEDRPARLVAGLRSEQKLNRL